MSIIRYEHTVGDTLTPLGMELQYRVGNEWVPVDLTNKIVTFFMVDEEGQTIVAEPDPLASNVDIDEPEEGKLSYDFAANEVALAGTYYGWCRVYSQGERDTYPGGGRVFKIKIIEAN
jgi:hypothetical protein